jgi:hypothetical protein
MPEMTQAEREGIGQEITSATSNLREAMRALEAGLCGLVLGRDEHEIGRSVRAAVTSLDEAKRHLHRLSASPPRRTP